MSGGFPRNPGGKVCPVCRIPYREHPTNWCLPLRFEEPLAQPHPPLVHWDDVFDHDPPKPAIKVGSHVIFPDGAGRKLTWRERWAWRRGRLLTVPRADAKLVLL